MTKANTTTKTTKANAVRNINPLTVEVAPDLIASFDAVSRAADEVALSTRALRHAAEMAGLKVTYFAAPNQDSTPEHRHGYAVLQRLAVGKLAALLGVQADAFEPVFNSAVQSGSDVSIGDETRTKKAWQQKIGNTLRPVKDAWLKSIRAEIDEAKSVAHYARADLIKLEAEAEKTAEQCKAADAAVAEAKVRVVKLHDAMDKAEGKERAKLAAHVKAAEAALDEKVEFATMVESLDQQALLAVAEQKEVVEECEVEVMQLSKLLPASRGAANRKTEAEAAIAKVDALIATLSKSDGTGFGSADLPEAIAFLKQARSALSL